MPRLLIHVEGQTEESFVNEMLGEHLRNKGFTSVGARLLGNARLRRHRGGIRRWEVVSEDIIRHLKQDREIITALMVDYYALPEDWPGRHAARSLTSVCDKAGCIESKLLESVRARYKSDDVGGRFIPLVMMHEFEALLFSEPDEFAKAIHRPDLAVSFAAIREGFHSPEEINDSAATSPSKRVIQLYPGYEKPLFGVLAALQIGLPAIRRECEHFDDWVTRLESAAQA